MSQSLADYLNENKIDTAGIQEVLLLYLSEISDDLPPEEILEQIVESTGQKDKVNVILNEIKGNTLAIEEAALSLLSSAWQYPEEAQRIKSIIAEVKKKMPVIDSREIAIAAVACVAIVTGGLVFSHHQHLQFTKGLQSSTNRCIRKENEIECIEEKEYEPFSDSVREASNLFREGAKSVEENLPELTSE